MDLYFEVATPLGFYVRVTQGRWNLIVTVKHPVMIGQENLVREALEKPEQVRRSRSDYNVYLFYRQVSPGRWICAVVKRLNDDGFLITVYPTEAVKEGTLIWPR